MRLGTFVLGGLIGAAAVIYLSDRKNRSMKFSAFTSPIDTLGKMMGGKKDFMGKAMNDFTNQVKPANAAASGASHSSTTSNAATFGTNGLSQVQKIVNEDPELKKAVNDILQDNGKTSANQQNLQ